MPAAARTRIVEVRAAAARNLPRMDTFGTCNALCRLSLCGETRKTAVRAGRVPARCCLPQIMETSGPGLGLGRGPDMKWESPGLVSAAAQASWQATPATGRTPTTHVLKPEPARLLTYTRCVCVCMADDCLQ